MFRYQFQFFLVFFLTSSLFIISCGDEDLETSEITSIESFQAPRNGDGRGGEGPRDDNQTSLSNVVAQSWMSLLLEVERYARGMRPNASARAIAYINLAAYETLNPAMRNLSSNSSRIPEFELNGNLSPNEIDWELALNACYNIVAPHFLLNLPNDKIESIKSLALEMEGDLSQDLSETEIEASIQWGTTVANQVIEYSQTDSEAETQILEPQPLSYEPPAGEGYWTYSAEQERALFPYWQNTRTFIIAVDQTVSNPPLTYSSNSNSPYFRQMKEVYDDNNTARYDDNEDLWIAEFWSDDVENLTFSPPARQISIAKQLIEQNSLDLEEALHLYLKVGFALNDAAVAAWKYKYEYMVMRPNVFIHQFIDPSFQTNLYRLIPWPNPTFPSYPSGHSCFASAAGGVFINFFGNRTRFTDRSHEGRSEFRGSPRSYTNFESMINENAFSRIPLGVHMRMDCQEGLELGYQIASAINDYRLERRRGA